MNKFIFLAVAVFCGSASAEQVVTLKLQSGAESFMLFKSLSTPNVGGVDEAGSSVLIRSYSTSDNAVQISCAQNSLSGNANCHIEFVLESAESVSTQVVVAPTGALVATLNASDSTKLSGILAQPKLYRSQEKVTVNFNGRAFQAPRLTIDCSSMSGNTSPKACQIVGFR